MTVGELIKELELIDENKIVIMTEPSGIGWTNISEIIEDDCQVKIVEDDNGLFHDS
tara:strand:+ start:168 stop:335 length:168 start_codon:yes stop_codon:yes gene_type:complete